VHFELKTKFLAMMVLNIFIVPDPIRPFLPVADSEDLFMRRIHGERGSTSLWGLWAALPEWIKGQSQGEKPLKLMAL